MRTIRDREGLEAFLSEHHGFEDAFLTWLEPVEYAGVEPDPVRLRLEYQVRGSWEAGTPRTMRELELVAAGVTNWTFLRTVMHSPGHCLAGVETFDAGQGSLGLAFDVPELMWLEFRELRVGDAVERDELTPPWVSECEWSATVPGASPPSPRAWADALAARGFVVAWHVYGGAPVEPEAVSGSYEGWYLARAAAPEDAAGSEAGLFFVCARERDGALAMAVRTHATEDLALLRAASAFVASLGDGEVRCGNCAFSAREWAAYLATGELPARLRGG